MPRTMPVSLSSGPGAQTPMPARFGCEISTPSSASSAPICAMTPEGPPATSVGVAARPGSRRTGRPPRLAGACRRGRCRWREVRPCSAVRRHGAHPGHALGEVLCAEGERAHHDGLGARLAQAGTVCSRMPPSRPARCGDRPCQPRSTLGFGKARRRLGREVLPLHADARAEQRQHRNPVDERRGGRDGRIQHKHDTGLQTLCGNSVERVGTVGMLGMDADEIGAGLANWSTCDRRMASETMRCTCSGRTVALRATTATRSGKNSMAGAKCPSATSM